MDAFLYSGPPVELEGLGICSLLNVKLQGPTKLHASTVDPAGTPHRRPEGKQAEDLSADVAWSFSDMTN